MHELAIAVSIVEMAEQEVAARGNPRVQAVHLRLGPLSGVVKEALLFSYEMACASTALEGSSLLIEEIPVKILCPNCSGPQSILSIQRMCCPECGAPATEIVQGKELEVVALEIQE